MFGSQKRAAEREARAQQYDRTARDLARQLDAHDLRGGDATVSDDLLMRAASASEAARLTRLYGKPNPRVRVF